MVFNYSFAQYLLCMSLHFDVFRPENLLNLALLVNDERGSERTHVFPAAHRLLAPHTKGIVEGHLCVSNKGDKNE